MAHDVFIAYASEDKVTADAVCAGLESRKIRCWIAPRDVLAGREYSEAIMDAIEGSRVLVLVFSGHANESVHVRREVERAVNGEIPILPFRIQDVAMSKQLRYFVGAHHWLDALTPPVEQHIEVLSQSVAALLGLPNHARVPVPLQPSTHQSEERSGLPVGSPARWLALFVILVVVAVVGAVLWSNHEKDSPRVRVREQLSRFDDAIQRYQLENRKLPETLEDLTLRTDRAPEPILDSIPDDPWGHPFEYARLGHREYTIRSLGPDGQADTEDDLRWPEAVR